MKPVLKTELYPFQRKGVKRTVRKFKGRVLNTCDMGLGKSIQALVAVVELDAFPLIIVSPANLKINWQDEVRKHYGMRSAILSGRKPHKSQFLISKRPIIIINYEILKRWVPLLRKLKPKAIILDEGHRIQSESSQATKYTRILCEEVAHILVLGGTPLDNGKPIQLFPSLNILRPDVFKSRYSFGFRFCKPKKSPWGWQFNGATNTNELNFILNREVMIRKRKEEVLKQLPAKSRFVVPMDLSDWKEYKHAESDLVGWLAKYDLRKAKRAERAERFVKFGYMLRLIAQLKMKAMLEWIDLFLKDTNEKLLFGIVHRKVAAELEEHYNGRCAVITGKTPMKDRKGILSAFHSNKKKRILVVNHQTALGYNVQATSTAGVGELPWKPGHVEQMINRLHGINRGKEGMPVMVYYLLAKGTMEMRLASLLKKKQDIIDQVLDGKNEGDPSEFDILDQLTLELTKGRK